MFEPDPHPKLSGMVGMIAVAIVAIGAYMLMNVERAFRTTTDESATAVIEGQ